MRKFDHGAAAASLTVLALALAAAVPARAQDGAGTAADQDRTDVGTIVVTARRQIDTPAEQVKRVSPGITDTITESQIERTVDLSLPEALSRLPGVSTDAFYGTADAGYVSLRGFDSRYNSMDIDGNPIWFSSQNNRGAQTGMFPASIVKETTVYKTVTPDQDGNSVGGHISLRTLRAFDGGSGRYVKLGGRIGDYEQESTVRPGLSWRLYGAGKTTFGADDRFGIVLGFNAQRYRNADRYGGVDSYVQVDGQDMVQSNLYSDSQYDKDVKNATFYGKVEMRSADDLYAFVSGTLYDESRQQFLQRTATYIYQSNGRTTNFDDGRADFTGGQGQTRAYDYDIQRNAKVLGTGVDFRVFDKGAIVLRGNYTDFSNDIRTRYPDAFIQAGVAGSYDLSGDVPTIAFANPASWNDPANWRYRNTSDSYRRFQSLKDDVYALRGDFSYNTHADARGLGVAVGAAWTRLDRQYDENRYNYRLPSGTVLLLSDVAEPGATMQGNSAVKMDWERFWSYVDAKGVLRNLDSALTADYALVEDVTAAHGAVYFSGGNFRLIAGVRYEYTDYSADTADVVSGATTPVSRGDRYGNWLPNVQATWDFTPRLRLRAAFTKTIGRADFADFAPGQTLSINANGVEVVSGTNPYLGPRVSTNYDASLEYYLHGGVIALAVFHKDLANETFDQRNEIYDSAGTLTRIETIPLNTGSAKVTGVEASVAARRLDFLPGPLARLGLNANFTWLDGTWDVVFTDGSTRSVGGLRNQPKWLANAVVTYDLGAVDLTASYQRRGRTFTGTFGTTSVGDRWIDGYDTLNFQASVQPMHGVRLTFEARNLTDSYIHQTTGLTGAVYNSVGSGRSYFVGFRVEY
ncbi:MAG: TonB-dependent receptor [Pseudomonadota bacterium]